MQIACKYAEYLQFCYVSKVIGKDISHLIIMIKLFYCRTFHQQDLTNGLTLMEGHQGQM